MALSSGCFVGYESLIVGSGVKAVELSCVRADRFAEVIGLIQTAGIRITSIHTPCPGRGVTLNLGATGDQWHATKKGLLEAGDIARECGAKFVVAHAFYCVSGALPADDLARMRVLRGRLSDEMKMADFVASASYQAAKAQAVKNLKHIMHAWKRRFPEHKLIIENLNPRIGYGGILFQDVVDIANVMDGDVGICLDIGHLTLAQTALGTDMHASVARARDLIWSVHVHDNFAGRHAADRRWNASTPDQELQEVDVHLPFLTRYRSLAENVGFHVQPDNVAFEGILCGSAQYAAKPVMEDELLSGSVPVGQLLGLLSDEVHIVLEFDSRYAPLDEILNEYHLFDRGIHPKLKQTLCVGGQ